MTPECIFKDRGDCEGPTMVKAHLIPKTVLFREIYYRARDEGMNQLPARQRAEAAQWDERCWAWMCGGTSRLAGHHGEYDAKQLPRVRPDELVEFLKEFDLEWMAERYA